MARLRFWYNYLLRLDYWPSFTGMVASELDAEQDHAPVKPVLQWVPQWGAYGMRGYWACRWRPGFSYKSGVGGTPQEAYEMWAQINEVQHG